MKPPENLPAAFGRKEKPAIIGSGFFFVNFYQF